MKPLSTLRRALEDENLLGSALAGPSWLTWRALLLAAMGEPLNAVELDAFTARTKRRSPPDKRIEEMWVVAGRRGGKTQAMSTFAVYLAGLVDHSDVLAPGERGVLPLIAPDMKQAKVALDYATGLLESTPHLSQLIADRTADTLRLTTGIDIEVRSASFRRLRGMTSIGVLADEACFWRSDESCNPDAEILTAVRPSLLTTRGPLVVISSPYARRGEVYDTYSRHFRPDGDPMILVAHGTSRDFNPSRAPAKSPRRGRGLCSQAKNDEPPAAALETEPEAEAGAITAIIAVGLIVAVGPIVGVGPIVAVRPITVAVAVVPVAVVPIAVAVAIVPIAVVAVPYLLNDTSVCFTIVDGRCSSHRCRSRLCCADRQRCCEKRDCQ